MQMVATASTAMLSGQVAMPWSVSGVTIAPSRMPTSTKQTRWNDLGTRIGRPASAAIDTTSTEPDIRPAGIPSLAKVMPPAAAISRVSSGGRTILRGGRAASPTINAVRVAVRQMTPMQGAYATRRALSTPAPTALRSSRPSACAPASSPASASRFARCANASWMCSSDSLSWLRQRREVVGPELRVQRHDREIEARMVPHHRLGGPWPRPREVVERAFEIGARGAPLDLADRVRHRPPVELLENHRDEPEQHGVRILAGIGTQRDFRYACPPSSARADRPPSTPYRAPRRTRVGEQRVALPCAGAQPANNPGRRFRARWNDLLVDESASRRLVADSTTTKVVDQSHGPNSEHTTGVHRPDKPTPNSNRRKMGRTEWPITRAQRRLPMNCSTISRRCGAARCSAR